MSGHLKTKRQPSVDKTAYNLKDSRYTDIASRYQNLPPIDAKPEISCQKSKFGGTKSVNLRP